MDKKASAKKSSLLAKNHLVLILSVGLLLVVTLVMLMFFLFKPDRSVTSYCKIYKEEDAKLAKAQGDTYSVTVFHHKSSNPADFVNAFSRLEQAAPDEIQPDVKTLKQIFQKIDSDPSQALTASMSGLGAEESVTKWTEGHCQ